MAKFHSISYVSLIYNILSSPVLYDIGDNVILIDDNQDYFSLVLKYETIFMVVYVEVFF